MNSPVNVQKHRFSHTGEFHRHPIGVFDCCIYVVWDSGEKTFFLLSLKKRKKKEEEEREVEEQRKKKKKDKEQEDKEEEKSSFNVIVSFIPVRCQALW